MVAEPREDSEVDGARRGARAGALPHLPALDGLRGLALLGVLFFHSKKALPGGYLGVDLFFVLSGYLITSLLLEEHRATGTIDLKAFWIRRARRLFPALLSLYPALAVYCAFFAEADELARIRGDALATLGYVANWWSIFSHKSYWEMFAAPSPLEHTWSLAIEEQFYIVWPLIVVLVLRARGPRPLAKLTVALLALSIATALAILLIHPSRTATARIYFGTDTRAAAILAGAALATALPPSAPPRSATAIRMLDALGLVSAIGLGAAWCLLGGEEPFLYRGGFWLTELGAVVLIACAVAGRERSLVARVLSFRPLALIGLISYGLYLWHWPIDVFISTRRFMTLSSLECRLLQFAFTFSIAIVSYRCFEKPIRSRGLPLGRPLVVVPASVALAVVLITATTRARPSLHTLRDEDRRPATVASSSTGAGSSDAATPAPFKIVVFGDSTANSLGWTLRGVQRPNVEVSLLGRDGCNLLYDTCYGEQWSKQLHEIEPDAIVLFLGGAFEHEAEAKDGRWVSACHPDWDARFEKNVTMRLSGVVADAREISARKVASAKVYVVTTPFPLADDVDNETVRRHVRCINKTLRKVVSGLDVTVIDLGEHLCPKEKCRLREDGASVLIRPDGIHFHMEGAKPMSAWVLDQLTPTAP